MNKDYYKILGVTEFDTAENIKSAYRKLARKWHPDIAGSSNETMRRFKEINEAYEILSNKVKKEEYDRARNFYKYAQEKNHKTENKNTTNNQTSNPNAKKREFGINWQEILHKKYKEHTSKKQENNTPIKGNDVTTDIEISVFEAITGTVKTINMLQTQICSKCKGKKFVNGSTCSCCNGKGEFSEYKKFTVKIPANIKNGSKIRLAGEGAKGLNGGKNGDLYIIINVKEEKEYKTEGLNIQKRVSITPYEAVLGCELKINTLNGNIITKIAPNTQNGQKIRLSGCGIVQNNHVGDMIINIEINIPKNLTTEEIELYKKLEEISKNKKGNL